MPRVPLATLPGQGLGSGRFSKCWPFLPWLSCTNPADAGEILDEQGVPVVEQEDPPGAWEPVEVGL